MIDGFASGIIVQMAKYVIHVSELQAAGGLAALVAHLRAGEEVIIQDDGRPLGVVHPAKPVRRTISQCIELAKAHEKETGEAPVLDPDFADDMQDIISHRQTWNPPAWD